MGLSILLATSPILKKRFQHINFNIVSGITNIEQRRDEKRTKCNLSYCFKTNKKSKQAKRKPTKKCD